MKEAIELSLEYNKTYIKNKKLYLDFDISTIDLNNIKLSIKEKKELILNQLPKEDRIYFKIVKYNLKKVTFLFDYLLWFKKSIKKISDTEDRYQKKIILKHIPRTILNNTNSYYITKFIEGAFRNYLNKDAKLRKAIRDCISQNIPLINFKFNFDGSNILIILKPEFRHNIIAVIKSKRNKEIKKMDFDSSVYTLLKLKKR